MSEKEKAILVAIGENAEKLGPVERQRLLGYSEGLAAAKDVQEAGNDPEDQEEEEKGA